MKSPLSVYRPLSIRPKPSYNPKTMSTSYKGFTHDNRLYQVKKRIGEETELNQRGSRLDNQMDDRSSTQDVAIQRKNQRTKGL